MSRSGELRSVMRCISIPKCFGAPGVAAQLLHTARIRYVYVVFSEHFVMHCMVLQCGFSLLIGVSNFRNLLMDN